MPEGIVPPKLDITVSFRGTINAEVFKGCSGYRMTPGWVSLVDVDGVEYCFSSGDGEGCAVALEVHPVAPPGGVRPGGSGVLRG